MSNTATKHTPTPWILGRGSLIQVFAVNPENPHCVNSTDALHVATIQRRDDKSVAQSHADAAFIVRACNAHEQLVAALTEAIEIIQAIDQTDNTCDKRIDVSDFRAALAAVAC